MTAIDDYFDVYLPLGTHLLNLRLAKVRFVEYDEIIFHMAWINIYEQHSKNYKNIRLLKIKKEKKDYNNEI